ncbi:MAG: 50S ribosomal protein L44e [Candidatus ainarchaeum sp.]|nr:50S ribosomal protein L44e [Candidatus ainarchaeum sp.]MDD3976080.1 50S ribosomal protein L44e [Candidatus ainarchaeum sp.]
MEIPKEIKGYCKKCKKHTLLKLKAYKPRKARANSKGTRKNIEKHKSGYGGKAKLIATVKKQNKKPVFMAECSECKGKQYFVIPKKMKKVEFKGQH